MGLGEADIDPEPDLQLVADQLRAERQDEGLPSVGRMGLLLAELAPEEVATGQAILERVIATEAVVTLLRGDRLVPVHLDGERVHVRDGLGGVATLHTSEPTLGQGRQRPTAAFPVPLLGQGAQKSGLRRLARKPVRGPPALGLRDRGLPTPERDCEPG